MSDGRTPRTSCWRSSAGTGATSPTALSAGAATFRPRAASLLFPTTEGLATAAPELLVGMELLVNAMANPGVIQLEEPVTAETEAAEAEPPKTRPSRRSGGTETRSAWTRRAASGLLSRRSGPRQRSVTRSLEAQSGSPTHIKLVLRHMCDTQNLLCSMKT